MRAIARQRNRCAPATIDCHRCRAKHRRAIVNRNRGPGIGAVHRTADRLPRLVGQPARRGDRHRRRDGVHRQCQSRARRTGIAKTVGLRCRQTVTALAQCAERIAPGPIAGDSDSGQCGAAIIDRHGIASSARTGQGLCSGVGHRVHHTTDCRCIDQRTRRRRQSRVQRDGVARSPIPLACQRQAGRDRAIGQAAEIGGIGGLSRGHCNRNGVAQAVGEGNRTGITGGEPGDGKRHAAFPRRVDRIGTAIDRKRRRRRQGDIHPAMAVAHHLEAIARIGCAGRQLDLFGGAAFGDRQDIACPQRRAAAGRERQPGQIDGVARSKAGHGVGDRDAAVEFERGRCARTKGDRPGSGRAGVAKFERAGAQRGAPGISVGAGQRDRARTVDHDAARPGAIADHAAKARCDRRSGIECQDIAAEHDRSRVRRVAVERGQSLVGVERQAGSCAAANAAQHHARRQRQRIGGAKLDAARFDVGIAAEGLHLRQFQNARVVGGAVILDQRTGLERAGAQQSGIADHTRIGAVGVLVEIDDATGVTDIGIARRHAGRGQVEYRTGFDERPARISVGRAGQLERADQQAHIARAGDRTGIDFAALFQELQLRSAGNGKAGGILQSAGGHAQLAALHRDRAARDKIERGFRDAGQIKQAGAGLDNRAADRRAGFGDRGPQRSGQIVTVTDGQHRAIAEIDDAVVARTAQCAECLVGGKCQRDFGRFFRFGQKHTGRVAGEHIRHTERKTARIDGDRTGFAADRAQRDRARSGKGQSTAAGDRCGNRIGAAAKDNPFAGAKRQRAATDRAALENQARWIVAIAQSHGVPRRGDRRAAVDRQRKGLRILSQRSVTGLVDHIAATSNPDAAGGPAAGLAVARADIAVRAICHKAIGVGGRSTVGDDPWRDNAVDQRRRGARKQFQRRAAQRAAADRLDQRGGRTRTDKAVGQRDRQPAGARVQCERSGRCGDERAECHSPGGGGARVGHGQGALRIAHRARPTGGVAIGVERAGACQIKRARRGKAARRLEDTAVELDLAEVRRRQSGVAQRRIARHAQGARDDVPTAVKLRIAASRRRDHDHALGAARCVVDREVRHAGGVADAGAVRTERHDLPGQRDDIAVGIERGDFTIDRDRAIGGERRGPATSRRADGDAGIAFGQAVEDDPVGRAHAGSDIGRVDCVSRRRGRAERGVAADDQRTGDQRGAAGIGVGSGQRDRKARIGAKLQDQTGPGRAQRGRAEGKAGDAGERAERVKRARCQRRIADGRADGDVRCQHGARQLPDFDRANHRLGGGVVEIEVPLGGQRNITRRQIGQAETAQGILIGLRPDEVRIEPGDLVEPWCRRTDRAGDVGRGGEQRRALVLQDRIFQPAIGVADQRRQAGGDRCTGGGVDGLRHTVVERQDKVVCRQRVPELAFGQVRIVGNDIDIDRGIAGAPHRIGHGGQRVMPVEQVQRPVGPDHHRLDIALEIGIDSGQRGQVIIAGGLVVDLGKTLVDLGWQHRTERNCIERKGPCRDRTCVCRIIRGECCGCKLAHVVPENQDCG